jgi:3-hydroxybutyryl-CoA dehydrogenase
MGHGVAQITAAAGYQVVAIENNDAALSVGMKRIEDSLSKVISKDVKKGIHTEAKGKETYNEIMSRIKPTTKISDAEDCDLIVEAILENMDLKLKFYKDLSTVIKPNAIFGW